MKVKGIVGIILVTAQGLLMTAGESPPAQDSSLLPRIIQKTIARDDANQKALRSVEYHETLKTQRLDDKGNVTQQQVMQMIVRPGAKQEVEVLSAKGDNLPSNPDEAVRQAQGKAGQAKMIDFSLKDMAGRFNISYAGTDTFKGVPVYVVAFAPKPNQPYRDQTEKVLNQLRGKIWISTKDYSVLKTDADLAAPVEVAWIFAEITQLHFHYELNNTEGALGPASFQTTVQVDAPFITIRQRMIVDMGNVVPRGGTISAL